MPLPKELREELARKRAAEHERAEQDKHRGLALAVLQCVAWSSLTSRQILLRMVLAVVALDAAAISTYSLAGLATAATSTRMVFTALWTAATIAILGVGLYRMR